MKSPSTKAADALPAALRAAADFEAMSRAAADDVAAAVRRTPDAILCLATGGSPSRAYDLLAEAGRREPGLFARVRAVKLDEWGGVAMDDPCTCEVYLREKVVGPLGIAPERYLAWETRPDDRDAECRRIAAWLRAHGPIDVCVLGLGANGHLGLNEPGASPDSGPHVESLAESTRRHPMLALARNRVDFGFTLGMADILKSRKVLLLVGGAAKAEPLRRLVTGPIGPEFPASLLRRHPDLAIHCDAEARGGI
jgi:galactosamine-6-phosphate isomerase